MTRELCYYIKEVEMLKYKKNLMIFREDKWLIYKNVNFKILQLHIFFVNSTAVSSVIYAHMILECQPAHLIAEQDNDWILDKSK